MSDEQLNPFPWCSTCATWHAPDKHITWKDSIMTHTEMCDEIDRLRRECDMRADDTLKLCKEIDGLNARLADEQAKRIEAEESVARLSDWSAWYTHLQHGDEKHREWLREAITAYIGGQHRPEPYGLGITEALQAKVADLERRLSTVPEDFGPLIDELISAAKRDARDPVDMDRADYASAALTEKIAALQFRLEALQKRFDAEEEAHAQLQARCFDNGQPTHGSVFGEVKELRSRLHTCELALSAVCHTNGGELYWSRETLDELSALSLEIDDRGARGVYFRAVERRCTCHPDDNPPRPCPQKFALTECRKAAASE